jgi:hypothetical protein
LRSFATTRSSPSRSALVASGYDCGVPIGWTRALGSGLMGYYLRAFCMSAEIPPLRTVFDWAETQGVRLEAPSADLETNAWEQAELVYKKDRSPIVAEANKGDLVREEIEEFTEFLEDVDDSPDNRPASGERAVRAKQLLASSTGVGVRHRFVLRPSSRGRAGRPRLLSERARPTPCPPRQPSSRAHWRSSLRSPLRSRPISRPSSSGEAGPRTRGSRSAPGTSRTS